MQLRIARLCLDCEDVHDQQLCPVCASESYAYISRWVTAPERRKVPRIPAPSPAPSVSTRRIAGYGMLGVAVAGLAGWWWKTRERIESSAMAGAGELK